GEQVVEFSGTRERREEIARCQVRDLDAATLVDFDEADGREDEQVQQRFRGHVAGSDSLAADASGAAGTSARVRISSITRSMKTSTAMTSCFLPAPRVRRATVCSSASRRPMTHMYGTFCTSPS